MYRFFVFCRSVKVWQLKVLTAICFCFETGLFTSCQQSLPLCLLLEMVDGGTHTPVGCPHVDGLGWQPYCFVLNPSFLSPQKCSKHLSSDLSDLATVFYDVWTHFCWSMKKHKLILRVLIQSKVVKAQNTKVRLSVKKKSTYLHLSFV